MADQESYSTDRILDEMTTALDQLKEIQNMSTLTWTPELEAKLEAIEHVLHFLQSEIQAIMEGIGVTQAELDDIRQDPNLLTPKERRFFKRIELLQEKAENALAENEKMVRTQESHQQAPTPKKRHKRQQGPKGARKGWKPL